MQKFATNHAALMVYTSLCWHEILLTKSYLLTGDLIWLFLRTLHSGIAENCKAVELAKHYERTEFIIRKLSNPRWDPYFSSDKGSHRYTDPFRINQINKIADLIGKPVPFFFGIIHFYQGPQLRFLISITISWWEFLEILKLINIYL